MSILHTSGVLKSTTQVHVLLTYEFTITNLSIVAVTPMNQTHACVMQHTNSAILITMYTYLDSLVT